MKNAVYISLKKPCSEKFKNFSKTAKGGFCLSCKQEVLDFSAMSNTYITKHLSTSKGKTCGRFKSVQLKSFQPKGFPKTYNKTWGKSLGILSFTMISFCTTGDLKAQGNTVLETKPGSELNLIRNQPISSTLIMQTHTVKGTVLDEENLPLPGVNVILMRTKEGTATDFDGKFEFPRTLKTGDILLFTYLGYETKEYIVPESTSKILDITITFDFADVELMGEVSVEGVYVSKRNVFQKFFDLFR